MQLPNTPTQTDHRDKSHKHGLVNALSITAIILSVFSLVSVMGAYASIPSQVDAYVQAHKSELKGADGKDGADGRNGMNGVNGRNSYSPTSCSTYSYSYGYSSTNCY